MLGRRKRRGELELESLETNYWVLEALDTQCGTAPPMSGGSRFLSYSLCHSYSPGHRGWGLGVGGYYQGSRSHQKLTHRGWPHGEQETTPQHSLLSAHLFETTQINYLNFLQTVHQLFGKMSMHHHCPQSLSKCPFSSFHQLHTSSSQMGSLNTQRTPSRTQAGHTPGSGSPSEYH